MPPDGEIIEFEFVQSSSIVMINAIISHFRTNYMELFLLSSELRDIFNIWSDSRLGIGPRWPNHKPPSTDFQSGNSFSSRSFSSPRDVFWDGILPSTSPNKFKIANCWYAHFSKTLQLSTFCRTPFSEDPWNLLASTRVASIGNTLLHKQIY